MFNPDPKAFRGDTFIAVTEDGAVIGWKSADDGTAVVEQDEAPAVYKGVAIGMAHGRPHLYAANFHAGTIDVFDTHFNRQAWRAPSPTRSCPPASRRSTSSMSARSCW